MRRRISIARQFFLWCDREAICTTHAIADLDLVKKSHPPIYGKLQSKNPARWLSLDEVSRLYDAASDGTWLGCATF